MPECGKPLTTNDTDEVFGTDTVTVTDPRSQHTLRNVKICKTCRYSNARNTSLLEQCDHCDAIVSGKTCSDYRRLTGG